MQFLPLLCLYCNTFFFFCQRFLLYSEKFFPKRKAWPHCPHTIGTMTEREAEICILIYQRRLREERNFALRVGMCGLRTAEQFLAALHALGGLNRREREGGSDAEILQNPA